MSATFIDDVLEYFEDESARRQKQTEASVQEAKAALQVYLLLRSASELKIASGISGSVDPRLLMLPCPDNVGDKDDGDNNLDGSQDPTCGASGSNAVNNILGAGSRFGRFPYRPHSPNGVNNTIYDGLGADFRDAEGNRLWYVLSRNMAPGSKSVTKKESFPIPLNFHRLMTTEKDWLAVVDSYGHTVSTKTAAVILAPGRAYSERVSESVLITSSYSYPKDVTVSVGSLNPENFFEAHTVAITTSPHHETVHKNYDRNGIFIDIRSDDDIKFNDVISHIDLHALMDSNGQFMKAYKKIVGITGMQNAPVKGSLLDKIYDATAAYYAVFGFYPPPAVTSTLYMNERLRHCAVSQTNSRQTVAFPAGALLQTPAAISVVATVGQKLVTLNNPSSVVATVEPATTITLNNPNAWLLAKNLTLTLLSSISVIIGDVPATVSLLTLVRYARVNLTSVTLSLSAGVSVANEISVNTTVMLSSPVIAVIPKMIPLSPGGDLFGWFPEHDNTRVAFGRAADDGNVFTLSVNTRVGFLSNTILTNSAMTLTVKAEDKLIFVAGEKIKLEKDFSQLTIPLSGTVHYVDGGETVAMNVLPTPTSYEQRQFVVPLFSDLIRSTRTVHAPAVLYPWRKELSSGGVDSRDNLHPYPPCFDSRNFYNRQFRLFIEDQPIFYAVAKDCHYGGNGAACGKTSGLTVSVAAGATVRLPEAVALTQFSFTVSSTTPAITVVNGTLSNSRAVILPDIFAIPLQTVSLTTPVMLGTLQISAGITLTTGNTLTAHAGTTLIAAGDELKDGLYFDNVPALLIYSPAPLPRVACTSDIPVGLLITTSTTPPITLSSQQEDTEDISPLCYWLDDEENADKDSVYRVAPPAGKTVPAMRNDYFLLFGGRLRI